MACGVNKGLPNLPYLQKIGREINRRLLEVERVSHNSRLSGDSIQRVARLFTRLETRVFRPAVAMFTSNDAVLPLPLRASLNRVDSQLDELIYQAFPQAKAS